MKRTTTIVCLLLCGLSAAAQTLPEEAVGIQTENPQGVLHIDGGATASQPADDVLVDGEGRLGVGVTAPAARVDIYADTPGGALRIADGEHEEGKVLISYDDEGTGRWARLSSVWWYAVLTRSATYGYSGEPASPVFEDRPYIAYANSLISSDIQGSVNPAAGTITVPYRGKYRITAAIHYMTNLTNNNYNNDPAGSPYWAKSALFVNNETSPRWTPSIWGGQRGLGTYPSFMAILNLEANDQLRLFLTQQEAFSANFGTANVFMVELLQLTSITQ